jgi:RimJ/RimL family protein N-acetyltransferase
VSATNELGQPVGEPVPSWRGCPFPDLAVLRGHWCTVEELRADHAAELYAELCGPEDASLWTYLPVGPFPGPAEFGDWLEQVVEDASTVSVAIRDGSGLACGIAHLMRIDRANGVVEVGGIVLGRRLQRTTAATEAFSLLAGHVFALGYRRFEWKCDSLNEPSRRAAERLGFRYEGRFRNAVVHKGRNRDTDWYSITDAEWPVVRKEHERWLHPANFDADGRQRTPLAVPAR